MTNTKLARLEGRGVLAVSGEDRVAFLQGLVSNDVERVAPDRAVYSAFLTPQGKFLLDFFMISDGDRLLLECEASELPAFAKKLRIYKLRSKVALEDVSAEFQCLAVFGGDAPGALGLPMEPGAAGACLGGIAFADPRLTAMGARILVPGDADIASLGLEEATTADYDAHRIDLGVPDGARDMEVEKTVLLEAGFDELNGVDWKKGCYMGQELTARTKYRGLVKRRLMPITADGPLPAPGTPITLDGREAGEVRSARNDRAMAMIRLNMLEDGAGPLRAGDVVITPRKPDWAVF